MNKNSVKKEIIEILKGVEDERKLKLILIYVKTLTK